MTSDTGATLARFVCAICGEEAGRLSLMHDETEARLVRNSFTSTLEQPIAPADGAGLRDRLSNISARALFEMDPELASFYCPQCNASYCGDHWARRDVFDDDGFHDSIRGRCPRGHERMLED